MNIRERRKKYKLYWINHDPYLNPYNNIIEKYCNGCKTIKSILEFTRDKTTKEGIKFRCKKCFLNYNKTYNQKCGYIFHKRWAKRNRTKFNEILHRYSISIPAIYSRLKQREKSISYTKEEFINWYKKQKDICYYCNIPESLIATGVVPSNRKTRKTFRLTIDRKDSKLGYSFNNMCLACDTCNIAKNNIFTEQEFKEIAQKYIKPKWFILQ